MLEPKRRWHCCLVPRQLVNCLHGTAPDLRRCRGPVSPKNEMKTGVAEKIRLLHVLVALHLVMQHATQLTANSTPWHVNFWTVQNQTHTHTHTHTFSHTPTHPHLHRLTHTHAHSVIHASSRLFGRAWANSHPHAALPPNRPMPAKPSLGKAAC
ncbi:hypothetical protein LY78DRAFT_473062 [Colletotrichum sublineola]|nr:hypothetical protein LY78DRAFT_473062 [Colletotrichum sublineola]